MAYDERRGRTVLVQANGSTWEYAGNDWTRIDTSTSPGQHFHPSMAYDSTRGRIVLFGGDLEGANPAHTWEYDGNDWTQKAIPGTPSQRDDGSAMAYDTDRQRMVLLHSDGQTWEYDGNAWTRVTTTSAPAARSYFGMAYDSGRKRTVVFGGGTSDPNSDQAFNDTWEYVSPPDPPTPTPEPGADQLPIVLVHGWKGLVRDQPCTKPTSDFSNESNGDFGAIDEQGRVDENRGLGAALRNADYKVVYAKLETSPCSTPRVQANVSRLKNAITEALRDSGHSKVILIAHSMGGLVSRAYIEDTTPNGYRKDVAELFTFGTPHLGVNISSNLWTTMFADECMTTASFMSLQAVLEDFKEDVRGEFNKNHPLNEDVVYHVISGNAPSNGRSVTGGLMDYVFGTVANDGIVPLQSGTGLPGEMDRLTVPEVHAPSLGSSDYFVKGTASYTCLEHVLIDKTSTTCGIVSPYVAVPLPPTQPKKLPPSAFAGLVTSYENTRMGAVCIAALAVELAIVAKIAPKEFAVAMAQYAIRAGKYVGGALIEFARRTAMSTRDFIIMVADYAAERGQEVAGEVARILGGWAEQAKLTASEMYTLTVEAIHHKLPFFSRRVYSPATLLVTNQAGQKAGVLEDGSVVEEIPGSKVVVVNSEKYIFLPPGNIVTTELKGTGTGTMTVELVNSDGTGNGQIVTYKDVPVTPELIAHVDEVSTQRELVLDMQGQSNTLQSRQPDKVEQISAEVPSNTGTAPDANPSSSTPRSSDNSTLLLIGGAVLLALSLVGIVATTLGRRRRIRQP